AFDEALVVGGVGVFEVDPEADAVGHSLPLLHVAPDALLALLDEGFDAVVFDFFFAVDAEFFADFDFDGKAVGVPAGFAFATVAGYRGVGGEEIFDGAGEAVAGVGHTVGGGWAFVEDEWGRVGALL